MSLMERLAWLSSKVKGARATFHFAPSIVELGDRFGVNRDLLSETVDDAVARVTAAIGDDSPFRTIALGRLGSLVIREDPKIPNLQFDAMGPVSEARKVGRRL